MSRDRTKDNKRFYCDDETAIDDVSLQYEDFNEIKLFINVNCVDEAIEKITYIKLYRLIKKKLGHPIPE